MSAQDTIKVSASAPPPYTQYPGQNAGPYEYGANTGAPAYGFQPQPGYPPAGGFDGQPGYPQAGYGATVITVPPVAVAPEVIILNGCPNCRNGVIESDFTCCGILLAILFFPIGLLCCWVLRERRCSFCRTQF